jgi:peptidoglycan/LPS O-acetylase OafA/YrhL
MFQQDSNAGLGAAISPPAIDARRIASFDALRVLLVLTVIVGHYLFPPGHPLAWISGTVMWAWAPSAAVSTFFMLSGLVITSTTLRDRRQGRGLRHFYIRRALRILPAFLFCCVLLVIGVPVMLRAMGYPPDQAAQIVSDSRPPLSAYLFFYNQADLRLLNPFIPFAHFWTLSVEEQFYLVWPGILFFSRDRRQMICAIKYIAVPVSIAGMLYYRFLSSNSGGIYAATLPNVMFLAIGALMSFYLSEIRTGKTFIYLMSLCGAGGVFLVGSDVRTPPGIIYDLFISVFLVLFCLCVVEPQLHRPSLKWMRSKRMVHLGTMTYGLYLFHLPVIVFMNTFHSHSGALPLISLALIASIALVSYVFIELPAMRLGKALMPVNQVGQAS